MCPIIPTFKWKFEKTLSLSIIHSVFWLLGAGFPILVVKEMNNFPLQDGNCDAVRELYRDEYSDRFLFFFRK